MGLLQDKVPAQPRAHPKGCVQRGALLQVAEVWICQGHADSPDPSAEHGWALRNDLSNDQVGELEMPNGWQTVSTSWEGMGSFKEKCLG